MGLTVGEMLIMVYGENAKEDFEKTYRQVMDDSNINDDLRDKDFMSVAAEFTAMNLEELIRGDIKPMTLRALICKSFGEAGMYKWNICAGNIAEGPVAERNN